MATMDVSVIANRAGPRQGGSAQARWKRTWTKMATKGGTKKTEPQTLVLGSLSHGPARARVPPESPVARNSVRMPSPWDRANEHSFERD